MRMEIKSLGGTPMKKLVALLLAAMLLCVCIPAMAEEAPEGYPEVVPGVDLGGISVTIYDYWSGDGARDENPDPQTQAQYDYRDWLMKTYNCTIEQKQDGDWGSNSSQLTNFFAAPDGSYRLYILPPDFVGGPMANNAFADWNNNDLIDLTAEKWNQATVQFMSSGDKVYGVSTGNSEPRACLFFNKRILSEAGIDWNTVYDLQANNEWTWQAWEDMMAKIQKDSDNDGVIDLYGFTGSKEDLLMCSVFGNGGSFFDFDEDGKLVITAGSDASMEALNWAKSVLDAYYWNGGPDAAWDFYKDAFKQGKAGFYVYQTYGGFNPNSELADMADEWGCVALPVKEAGMTLVTTVSDNITVIPNVYDDETVAKLAFIYDMWTNDTPGYDDEFAWIGNKYDYTDDRAVDETYAMLRESDHCVANKCLYLGSVNDVLGDGFLWNMLSQTPAELLESITPKWQGMCDTFNASK